MTGLTVTTPSATYYEFEALRESEDDIIERDPNRVVSTLRNQYRRAMPLDLDSVQDVEPLMLVRYDPGVELLVGDVQIERDRVRLSLQGTQRRSRHDLDGAMAGPVVERFHRKRRWSRASWLGSSAGNRHSGIRLTQAVALLPPVHLGKETAVREGAIFPRCGYRRAPRSRWR